MSCSIVDYPMPKKIAVHIDDYLPPRPCVIQLALLHEGDYQATVTAMVDNKNLRFAVPRKLSWDDILYERYSLLGETACQVTYDSDPKIPVLLDLPDWLVIGQIVDDPPEVEII